MAAELVRAVRLAQGGWQQHALIGGAGALFAVLALFPLLWPLVELAGRE